MASKRDLGIRWLPVAEIKSPPFCWVVLHRDGDKVHFINEGLPIFETWQDAQDLIDKLHLVRCTPKLFFWDVLVRNLQELNQEAVLDRKDGTYVSFPLAL